MEKLTQKEEEILQLYWDNGPMFVNELRELFDEPRPHFNTLSTITRTLETKGYLSHKRYGSTYQYFTIISRQEYSRSSLRKVINKYFDNSCFSAVSALVKEEQLSDEELAELITLINSKKR